MDPRYPIGEFAYDAEVTPDKRRGWIAQLDALPRNLEQTLRQLPAGALDTPYREGGWTARQVVHHVADSHMNAYIRIKLALTEATPTVKTYDEARWAELSDGRGADPAVSLAILTGLHHRLSALLNSLTPEQFACTLQHPEWGAITVDFLVQLYAWHCRHHVAHIGLVAPRAAAPMSS
ncbi:MAG: YfiT family bacillithiol transferase [Acidobacteriota bacterium]